jgi:hypothetical protein
MKLSRSVNKVLQESDSELAILVTRTRQLNRLTNAFRSLLEPELAKHCYIGNIDEDCLSILVDSAAWASKFRFYSQSILPALNQLDPIFKEVNKIQIKILNQRAEAKPPAYQRPQMNQENANGLMTLAENVDDSHLQAALTRLAKKAKPES